MKRAQAALEFLTTYGWAFLVILIMISALAYFGVLRPSRLLPDRCSFGAEFECRDFQISQIDDTVKVKLKNNVGGAITVNSMSVSTESAITLNCTGDPDFTGVWPLGGIRDFIFTECNTGEVGFVSGDKGKVSINLGYYSVRSGSEYSHIVSGTIFATVI